MGRHQEKHEKNIEAEICSLVVSGSKLFKFSGDEPLTAFSAEVYDFGFSYVCYPQSPPTANPCSNCMHLKYMHTVILKMPSSDTNPDSELDQTALKVSAFALSPVRKQNPKNQ